MLAWLWNWARKKRQEGRSRSAKRTRCHLEQLEARDCPSTMTWIASTTGNWNDGSNWSGGVAPTTVDDVILGDGVHNGRCIFSGFPGQAANSVTLTANYQGTLEVDGTLTTNLFELDGGAVEQPNGIGLSDINTTTFNWVDGILNATAILANINIQDGGEAQIYGNDKVDGSDIKLGQGAYGSLGIAGNWTFTNNAGISIGKNATFNWENANAKIVSSGTGQIVNNGGTFLKSIDTGANQVVSGLPYVQNGGNLLVPEGKMTFTRALGGGFSVILNAGIAGLGDVRTATLDAPVGGVLLNGATLNSSKGSKINGNLFMQDGLIDLGGADAIDTLWVEGNFTMIGGTYKATVNMTTMQADQILARANVTLGALATLEVNCIAVPAQWNANQTIDILKVTGDGTEKISGDFGTKTLDIGTTGKKFTTQKANTDKNYQLVTP
jgi:hypothetical protein